MINLKNINKSTTQKKKGQIMLITLLVLMILGIIVVSIVVLTRRDVQQVVNTEKYEQALNTSESNILNVIRKYGDYTTSLSSLPNDFNSASSGTCTQGIVSTNSNQFDCTFTNVDLTEANLFTEMTISDMRSVDDFTINKDQSIVLNLNGYNQGIDLSWTGSSVALDFSLIYRAGGPAGNYAILKDVFDMDQVYTSLATDNPYDNLNPIHPYNFTINNASDTNNTVRFNISSFDAWNAANSTVSLRITARTREAYGSIDLDVTASNPGNFPYQIRQFESVSFDPSDSSSPVARVITQIPLYPQVDSVFDHSFITNDAVDTN